MNGLVDLAVDGDHGNYDGREEDQQTYRQVKIQSLLIEAQSYGDQAEGNQEDEKPAIEYPEKLSDRLTYCLSQIRVHGFKEEGMMMDHPIRRHRSPRDCDRWLWPGAELCQHMQPGARQFRCLAWGWPLLLSLL